jgi:hypothetical protein
MSVLPNNVVGCDFCEHTSKDWGRIIYECEECGADCCSSCSASDPEDCCRVLCAPDPSSGRAGCAPEDWA